ncbi:hypothetical protein N2152v2_006577 [Parachlorella kessleri]
MARLTVVLACCLLLSTGALADAGVECPAQLTRAQEKLVEAEGRCKTDAEQLNSKLQAANKEVTDLQAKVNAWYQEAERLKKVAESGAVEAKQKLEAAAKAAEAKLSDAIKARDVQKADLAAALKARDAKEAELAALQKELRKAREAAESFEALRAHHESAWLPHWLDKLSRSALEAARPTLLAGRELAVKYSGESGKKAAEFWSIHVTPALKNAFAVLKVKASQLSDVVEKQLPQVKTAATRAHAAAVDALQSKQVAAAKAATLDSIRKSRETFDTVVSELEAFLITFFQKYPNTKPLARKPYVTYIVYLAMVVPVVAVGMPLLGKLLSGGAGSAEPASSSLSGKKPKRPKKRLA